jgi:uncharacterized protein YjbI with pentapeptide repeats
MAKLSYRRCAVVGSLCFLALVLCASSALGAGKAPKKPKTQKISLLYVLNSASGNLIPKKGKGAGYKLVLRGLDHDVTWFSDRPARKSGSFPTTALAEAWKGFGFKADPPNAALTYTDPSGDPGRTVIVELSHPRYAKGRLSFAARVLDPDSIKEPNLADHAAAADRDPTRKVKDASLFIDDGTAPVAGGCVLQPFTRCEGMDLGPLNLSGMYLQGANFSRSELDGSDFLTSHLEETAFVGASLEHSNLKEAMLANADLEKADLKHASFYLSLLIGANLESADLAEAEMEITNLSSAALTDANFTRAFIRDISSAAFFGPSRNVNFTEARLVGPFLPDAQLYSSNFERADLTEAWLPLEYLEKLEGQQNNFCHALMGEGSGQCFPTASM